MAHKRMFNIDLANNDNFIDLPAAAQALYFHLGLRADDDGFVGGIKQIVRGLGFKSEDIQPLIDAGYVIKFDSGVIAISDWRINNYIRKDRYTPTLYQKEFAMLQVIDDRYILGDSIRNEYVQPSVNNQNGNAEPSDNQVTTACQPPDNQVTTQISLDQYRLDKVSVDEDSVVKNKHPQQLIQTSDQEVIRFVERELGILLSSVAIDKINAWLDEWPDREVIRMAVSEAVLNNKRSINYVDAILRDWRNKGIKTITQVEAAKAEYETKKANAAANKGQQSKTRAPDNFKTSGRDLDFLVE